MKWFRSLFAGKAADPVLKIVDSDFGAITYDGEATGIWQTDGDVVDAAHHARYGFSAIPGDQRGPFGWSRVFLVQKKRELPRLWELCSTSLLEVCERWKAKGLRPPVQKQFVLTSISVAEDFQTSGAWDVGFQSEGDFWTFVEVRFVGDEVQGHTSDT